MIALETRTKKQFRLCGVTKRQCPS